MKQFEFRAAQRFAKWISPAQCGGLIEALSATDREAPEIVDFPRAMRGPH